MKRIFFAFFALMCVNLAFLANLNAESFPKITSIKADFTQEIKGSEGEGAIKYSGSLVARADSKAYWRYESPMKKEIFVDKKRILIYEPEFEQVIVSDKIDIDFVAILNAVRKSSDSDDEWESVVKNQTFRIIFKNGKPHRIFYKDELDNEVAITLENVVLNQSVEILAPKFPSSVEVIYQ